MVARLGAIAQGLPLRQYWVSTILNAAATYEPNRDQAAETWESSRRGLSNEMRGTSFRDALGGAAHPPPAQQQTSAPARVASNERFSAAARRAEERRSSSGMASAGARVAASPLDRGRAGACRPSGRSPYAEVVAAER